MKIALYARPLNKSSLPYVKEVIDSLHLHSVEIAVYDGFQYFLAENNIHIGTVSVFTDYKGLRAFQADCLLSLGGDGTLLDTLNFVQDSRLPVLGINLGRLGYLASIAKHEIAGAVASLIRGKYSIDVRSLIGVKCSDEQSLNGLGIPYALNDITFHREDRSSMIGIHTHLDGEFLNSYWADGVIVSTPTGSTSYSLSCGGPIVFPTAANFIITPICPHNLTMRPVVIPDNSELSFNIESRSGKFLLTLDSRTVVLNNDVKLVIRKENFTLNLIRLSNEGYITVLRNKLMWGVDARN